MLIMFYRFILLVKDINIKRNIKLKNNKKQNNHDTFFSFIF